MLFSAWLQAIGAFLLVVFVLALVHLAGVATRFAGRMTQLVAAVILAVCLSEGTFEMDVIQATTNRHTQAALTSFDLAYVFVHVFAIAPALILMLGIAFLGTRLLPRVFVYLALALGGAMVIVGFAGLRVSLAPSQSPCSSFCRLSRRSGTRPLESHSSSVRERPLTHLQRNNEHCY